MDNQGDEENRVRKFKCLEARKNALEKKISERCFELKKLCIAEAELTGVIPLEIPLDADESPPKIRRRVGTMFPFSEDNINQLQLHQVSNLPVNMMGKSPKRKATSPWKTYSEDEPENIHTLSPKQVSTWPQKRHSPVKQSVSQRSHPYKAKFNLLKKW